MAVASNSRFKFTPLMLTQLDDGTPVETYGSWIRPDFFSDPNLKVTNYSVPAAFAGRADSISKAVYNTAEYFWVIIAFNNPLDPLNWPKAGDLIQIPDIATIASSM